MTLSPEIIRKSIESLLSLQEIDEKIFKLRAEEKTLPLKLQEIHGKLEEAQKSIRVIDKAFKEVDRERRALELRNLTLKEDLKRSEARKRDLRGSKEEFGATKDFENMQKKGSEIAKALEEKQTAANGKQTLREAKQKVIDELQAEWEKAQVDEKSRQDRLKEEIKALESQRDVHISVVDEEVFSIYERVQKIRRGNGIALVKDFMCMGCFVTVPPQLALKLDRLEEILTCPSCSRILYPDSGQKKASNLVH